MVTSLTHRLGNIQDEFLFPLHNQFSKIFNEVFGNDFTGVGYYPKLDIAVEGTEFVIRAAVPGVEPDAVKVEIQPDPDVYDATLLRISGEMNQSYKTKKEDMVVVNELHKSRFSRTIRLPEYLDGDPTAEVKDGLLTLRWKTKLPQEKKPKQIEVKKA